MPYIQHGHDKDFRQFKYKGGSVSITYQYLWSPFAQFLLKYVPPWVAPNLITLIAFVIVLITHFIFMYYDQPSFEHILPKWKYLLFSGCLFLYQHLDNLDGKQARHTKSSSPIGMLFDHGTDALTSMIVGIQIIKFLQVQQTEFAILALVFLIMIPNFLGIWTQYGVGQFKLDRINPIDEGLPFYQILCLYAYFFDFSFWTKTGLYTSLNKEFFISFGFSVVLICYKMCRNVFKDSPRKAEDLLKVFILPLSLIIVLSLFDWTGMDKVMYGQHFYVFFYILLFYWGRNMMLMQVCSVTNQRYNPFNIGTSFFFLAMLAPLCSQFLKDNLGVYLTIVMVAQLIILLEFIVSFLTQAKHILGIDLFRIKYVQKTD